MHIRTKQMINNINILYRFYILEDNDDLIKLINDGTYKVNLDKINSIVDKKEIIIDEISKYLKEGWTFERLDNLEKAILTIGVYDIKYRKIDKKIIINECINISKMLLLNDNYKYINAILDKIN